MKNWYYHRTLWSHFAAFADLFNDMKVYNYDKETGEFLGYREVPLYMAPKEKVVSVLGVVPGNPKPEIDNVLPRMSLIWTGIASNSERRRGQQQKRRLAIEYVEDGEIRDTIYDYQTVPYDVTMELTIWTKHMDHGAQLLENILPFFNPDLHLSLRERGAGIERKVKVTLDSINPNFTYDLNEPDRRILQWNLTFTMECNLYKPLKVGGDIRNVIIRAYNVDPRQPTRVDGFQVMTAVTSGWGSATKLDDDIRSVISKMEDWDEDYKDIYEDSSTEDGGCVTTYTEDISAVDSWKEVQDLRFEVDMNVINSINSSNLSNEEKLRRIDAYLKSLEMTKFVYNEDNGNFDEVNIEKTHTDKGFMLLDPDPYKELGIDNPWKEGE